MTGISVPRIVRLSVVSAAIVGAAIGAALIPTAAIASAPVEQSAVVVQERTAGAAMLGGWVGGGVLLLGTSVLVASASVRQPRRETVPAEA